MSLEKRKDKYSFWKYFEELTKIPRGSGNTEKVAEYLVKFAKDHSLKYIKEDCGNVIIFAPASKGRESEAAVIIQGHMDMVAVKAPKCKKDLEKDGLDLIVDGGLLGAKGTSLGADDGIAIAYALALITDEKASHPAIEAVFTVDEEVGMDGAIALNASVLKGRTLINIDSEKEDEVLSSCAGGACIEASIPVERKVRAANVYEIRVKGLKGGHSGTEIHKGGVSAATVIARFFEELSLVRTRVMELECGEKDNAIASEGRIKFICSAPKPDVIETVEFYTEALKEEFKTREPEFEIEFECVAEGETVNALHRADSDRIMHYLLALPQGVDTYSMDIPGLVETSNNIGVIKLLEDKLITRVSVRSSYESAKQALCDKVIACAKLAGGEATQGGDYPGWSYNKDSKLRAKYVSVYKEIYGKRPKVEAIHAGVECGIFVDKIDNLDCISIGPDIHNIHTTRERLDMDSAERMYELVKKMLEK